MPDSGKQVIRVRSESHSDVADTPAARAHQKALAESQFGAALLHQLRAAKGELRLREFRDEWLNTDDGLVYEISAEAVVVEE